MTVDEIHKIVEEHFNATGKCPEYIEVEKETLLRMKMQHHQETCENIASRKPTPPVSGRGYSFGGLLGGTWGNWKTIDHQAPEYKHDYAKWRKQMDEEQARDIFNEQMACYTPYGMVILKAKNAESDSSS